VAQHAEHRGDADAAGDQEERPIIAGWIDERPARGAYREHRARAGHRMQRAGDEALTLHGDRELARCRGRRGDGVAPHVITPIDPHPNGQELAGDEIKALGPGHAEGPDVRRFLKDQEERYLDEAGRPSFRASSAF